MEESTQKAAPDVVPRPLEIPDTTPLEWSEPHTYRAEVKDGPFTLLVVVFENADGTCDLQVDEAIGPEQVNKRLLLRYADPVENVKRLAAYLARAWLDDQDVNVIARNLTIEALRRVVMVRPA